MEFESRIRDLENRVKDLESDQLSDKERLGLLERQHNQDRKELGINSRATLAFLGTLLVLILVGSRYTSGQYEFQVPLSELMQILALPVVGAIVAALIPARRASD